MAIILKKLKGKPTKRGEQAADWDRLLTLIKILLTLFVAFSAFHWIVQKRIDTLPSTTSLLNKVTEHDAQTGVHSKLYTVRAGDTLWSIARTQYPKENPSKIVVEIENLNHFTKPLKPGEPIKLP